MVTTPSAVRFPYCELLKRARAVYTRVFVAANMR
jgi:hypothetical protein